MVTAVLADYRGYDTMFETVVIFIAGIAIFAVVRVSRNNSPVCGARIKMMNLTLSSPLPVDFLFQ